MATPAELIKAVSTVTGLPYATVVDFDRRLTVAGLRTKGGRGYSAARVTPLDAARLLTAILGSPLATKSVETVRRYTKALVDPDRSSETSFANAGIGALTALPDRHGFVEALASLITAAGSWANAKDPKSGAMPGIEIFAFTRATYGRIRLSNLPGEMSVNIEYLPASARRQSAKQSDAAGDLEQSRRITERTILAVAHLLQKEK
jgi:hypothetical protein